MMKEVGFYGNAEGEREGFSIKKCLRHSPNDPKIESSESIWKEEFIDIESKGENVSLNCTGH